MKSCAYTQDLQSWLLKGSILSLISIYFFLIMAAPVHGGSSSSRPSLGDKRARANVHFKKGETHQDMGRYKDAADAYEKAVDIDPKYAEAYSNLGYSYRKLGDYDRAIRTYKRAIKLKPDLAEAHEYIGEAYAETKKFDLAERHLGILKKLDSSEAIELAEFIEKMKKQR